MKLRVLIFLTLGLMAQGPALARTWRVELNGTGDYTDIQPAVEAAAPGDTIRIGPGRFDVFHPITAPAWTEDTIVGVLKDNLTFIGSGKEVTFLGPAALKAYGVWSMVFCSFGGFSATLEDMTLENVSTENTSQVGVYWERGVLTVRDCVFRSRNPNYTALLLMVDNGSVSDCQFDLVGGGGDAIIINNINSTTQGFEISNCFIDGAAFGVNVGYGAPNISIRDTEMNVKSKGVVFWAASTGEIARCHIEVHPNTVPLGTDDSGVVATMNSIVSIADSEINGAPYGLHASDGGSIIASRTIVSGTVCGALALSWRGQISLTGCHILPTSGWAVYCYAFNWSPITVDLTGNYWGTTDSGEIAASIYDSHDDPAVPYTITYAPYASGPLPAETMTWGDLKALFR